MEDRLEEVVGQYGLTVKARYRARGGTLFDTDGGLVFLKQLEEAKSHLYVEAAVTGHLADKGYPDTDRIFWTTGGDITSRDNFGQEYVLRRGIRGDACDLKELEEVKLAAENLAILHSNLQGIFPQQVAQNNVLRTDTLENSYTRHNRELKRVRQYIRNKNNKNEFEVCVLASFDSFWHKAEESLHLIGEMDLETRMKEGVEKGIYIHGDYTYHNVLFVENKTATTHFEHTQNGLQIQDLYDFLRKTMEKNNWSPAFGIAVLESYDKRKTLSREEKRLLYVQLLYPEKYWKVLNQYYNNKKSWISARNISKLQDLRMQEEAKEKFLRYLEEK